VQHKPRDKPRARIDQPPMADLLALAIEAAVTEVARAGDWAVLGAWGEREGVETVARALAQRAGPRGPTEQWWVCNVLLGMERPACEALRICCELVELEAHGDGPAFDLDRHALEVSTAVRYLERHLQRLRAGVATREESGVARLAACAVRVVGGG
jgi:hypothetical protein